MSKEHVFPDWLKEIFPRSASDTHTHGITSWVDLGVDQLSPVTELHRKQGQAGSKKVRVVCKDCNGIWMSKIEENTKSLLIQLMGNQPVTLGTAERLLLATWAAKTTMTAEYVDRTKVAIPQSDRSHLRAEKTPPSRGWRIWIGRNESPEWTTGLHHYVAHLNVPPIDTPTPAGLNVQSTIIGLGHAIFYVISTTTDFDFNLANPDSSDLRPLWPEPTADIVWPLCTFLDEDKIVALTTNLARSKTVQG